MPWMREVGVASGPSHWYHPCNSNFTVMQRFQHHGNLLFQWKVLEAMCRVAVSVFLWVNLAVRWRQRYNKNPGREICRNVGPLLGRFTTGRQASLRGKSYRLKPEMSQELGCPQWWGLISRHLSYTVNIDLMFAFLGFDLAHSCASFLFMFFFRMGMWALLHHTLEVGELFSDFFNVDSQINMPWASKQTLNFWIILALWRLYWFWDMNWTFCFMR